MPNVFYGTNDSDVLNPSPIKYQFMFGFGGDDELVTTGDPVYCEIFGGDGDDFLAFGAFSFGLADGGTGNDEFSGGGVSDEIYGGRGNDIVRASGGDDFVDGGPGNDTMRGDAGNDRIYGGSGIDDCNGSEGNDRLFGGTGGDSLDGGADADVLVGGKGSDTLNGGDTDAIDIFRFTSVKDSLPGASKRDTIVFSAEDIIDLSRIDANTNRAGDQKFTFIGDDAFSGKAGQLRFVETDLAAGLLLGDVNGDRKADFQIHVIDAFVLVDNLVL